MFIGKHIQPDILFYHYKDKITLKKIVPLVYKINLKKPNREDAAGSDGASAASKQNRNGNGKERMTEGDIPPLESFRASRG